MAAKIKKGDKVIVLTGKDKGRTGEVVKSLPDENRVVVSGINVVARHTRPSQADPQGGIKRKEASIHISNVAHVDPKDGKATRVGFKTITEKGEEKKVRFSKRSGENIDA
jgi:large subunit ribosomal protein L24